MKTESRQFKFLVEAGLASAFKSACKNAGLSMADELAAHMAKYVRDSKPPTLKTSPIRIATRRDRRIAMRSIVTMLTSVKDAESAYMERIPESLASGPVYEAAEAAVGMMDEAISLLEEAF